MCCLFGGSLWLRRLKSCSIGSRSGDWLGHWGMSHFFCLKSTFIPLQLCAVLSARQHLAQSEEKADLQSSECILLLLSAATSQINTNNPVWLTAIRANARALPPSCLADDVLCFRSPSTPVLLHIFSYHYSDIHLKFSCLYHLFF